MSSSISSATSQQQFVQVQQNAVKTDATKGNASSNANAQSPQSAQTTQAAQTPPAPAQTAKPAVAVAGASANGIPVSKFHRNSDGTFGPGHTALPPYNPLKPSTQDSVASQPSTDSEVGGVNVQI